jgi:hypothetical protein
VRGHVFSILSVGGRPKLEAAELLAAKLQAYHKMLKALPKLEAAELLAAELEAYY